MNGYDPDRPGYHGETFEDIAFAQGRTVQIAHMPTSWGRYHLRRFIKYTLSVDERLQTLRRFRNGLVEIVFISRAEAQRFVKEASKLRCGGRILSVRWLNPDEKKI